MVRSYKADRAAVSELLKAYHGDRAAVARHLQRDVRFVKRWEERCASGQDTCNKPGAGRKRLLSGAATSAAKRMASGDTKLSSKAIAKKLYDSGKTQQRTSPSTVKRALAGGRAAIVWKSTIRRHRLTERHKKLRLQWCRDHLHVDWERVMATDSHKLTQGKATGRKRWQNPRHPAVIETEHHGISEHLYVGATVHGVTKCHLVSGTTGLQTGTKAVCSAEYQRVIAETFIPEGQRMFRGQTFVVYQDGAKPHTSASTTRKWESYQEVATVLQSPPLSPDLNWVENIWNELDDKLMGKRYKSMTSFKAAIQKALSEITPAFCRKQVASMPRRLRKCIKAKGGHIERTIYT